MSWFSEIAQGLLGRRPALLQVGAICTRKRDGRMQVLLVTSRGTGRWIIPKGWPMRGRSLAGAAQQEAWEEGGVKGRIDPDPLGYYSYPKKLDSGLVVPAEVTVYRLRVKIMAEDFPEAAERRRKWVPPCKAAGMVAEPGLQEILRRL